MSSYALCTIVLSAEGQVSGADFARAGGPLWFASGHKQPSREGLLRRRSLTPVSVRGTRRPNRNGHEYILSRSSALAARQAPQPPVRRGLGRRSATILLAASSEITEAMR